MKRYRLVLAGGLHEVDDGGDFMRYSDHAAVVEKLKDAGDDLAALAWLSQGEACEALAAWRKAKEEA